MACWDGNEETRSKSARHQKKFTKVFKPTESRGCTDSLCLVFWILCVAGFVTTAVLAIICERLARRHGAVSGGARAPYNASSSPARLPARARLLTPRVRPHPSSSGGDVNYVLYPVDYKGQFCGLTEGLVEKKKIFYPRLDTDIADALPLLTTPTGILYFRPYGLCAYGPSAPERSRPPPDLLRISSGSPPYLRSVSARYPLGLC